MDVELKLLNTIIENEKINQRAIAKEVGVSLGTINSMLRHLEGQDYVLISKSGHNSARYLLTEEGKAYRSEKLYDYIIECSELISQVRANLKGIFSSLIGQGVENFYMSEREDEFYRIVVLILMEISRKASISYYLKVAEEVRQDGIILGWQANNPYRHHHRYLHLIHKI